MAPASAWLTPAWDPLALTSLAADSDLPASVLATVPLAAPVGAVVPAGTIVGVLGSPSSGRWLAALPAVARPAVASAAAVWVAWGGHTAEQARFVAGGPAIGGRFLAVLQTVAAARPDPPARTHVIVTLPPAHGVLVPAGAVRLVGHGADVWRLDAARRIVRVPVHVLGMAGGWSAVSGLSARARVLARPWVLARLVAIRA